MSYTLRKCERYTNWEATEGVELNPEDFRDISFPYEGETEEEFLHYIEEMELDWDWYEICDELENLDRLEAADALAMLFEGEMTVYSSTTDNEGTFWFDSGEVNEEYTKWGGFKVNHTTV